jgi:predicted amidophosphoribosyltransferase
MTVNDSSRLKDATVVVLDDTATTGTSLKAARQLLEEAGAKKIAAVAIGRTVKYF